MRNAKRAMVFALVAVGVLLSQAVPAATAQTAPGYEMFAGCPNVPQVLLCIRSETNSGHIQIGSTDTPINQQITLSGGVTSTEVLANEQGGLIAPPLNVPGGLTGLTGLPEFLINLLTFGAHQVQAQAILVGQPVLSNPALGVTQLTMPIRVKLINPFLASTCSLGSATNPIVLNLTTGTTAPPPPNQPISGSQTPLAPHPTLPLTLIGEDWTLVDNSFAVPGATGCTLLGFGLLNPIVNARVGLPAPAGTNEAVMSDTTLLSAARQAVYP